MSSAKLMMTNLFLEPLFPGFILTLKNRLLKQKLLLGIIHIPLCYKLCTTILEPRSRKIKSKYENRRTERDIPPCPYLDYPGYDLLVGEMTRRTRWLMLSQVVPNPTAIIPKYSGLKSYPNTPKVTCPLVLSPIAMSAPRIPNQKFGALWYISKPLHPHIRY